MGTGVLRPSYDGTQDRKTRINHGFVLRSADESGPNH